MCSTGPVWGRRAMELRHLKYFVAVAKVQGLTYRRLATASPMIDLIAAWRRDNTSPLPARVTQKIRAVCAAMPAAN